MNVIGKLDSFRPCVLIAAGLLLGVQGCDESQADDTTVLTTAPVVRTDLRITVEANGLVEPIRVVEVKSKAGGEVLGLHVDVGDVVDPGQLMVEIDPRDVENGFDQAEAELEVSRVNLSISEAQLERSNRLLETGVITEQEHESAALSYANAQSSLVRAEANFELAELRLQDVTIRAASRGTILTKLIEEGTVITAASGTSATGGSVLFTMASLEEMQVRTLIDETDMGQIQPGMEAIVRVEAYPDREFVGFVDKIEPQAVVQQNVTMFPVIVILDNSSDLLRPSMNAEVEIQVDEAINVLVASNGAIVESQDAAPAAEVLGLDPTQFDFRAVLTGRTAQAVGGPQGLAEGQEDAQDESEGEGGMPDLARIREMVRNGEISQDSARALFGGRSGGGQRGGRGGLVGRGGVGDDSVRDAVRRAIVFVVNADGTIEPRGVQLGLNDWDNTEIRIGLEEGEELALIGPAQLQARRQEQLDRFRNRAGGIIPGGRR